MRLVVALGGNALLQRGDPPDAWIQMERLHAVAPVIGELASRHELLLVHGNGPQVGMLALESSDDRSLSAPYPLDDLVAETQGMIGYWLQQAIGNSSGKPAVALITQTLVAAEDPAFADPSKFVGRVYARSEGHSLAALHGWSLLEDGDGWRRVVASPRPVEVVETPLADLLLAQGACVILGGGGGVPVVREGGELRGVEAVVDKDYVAGLIAEQLGADAFIVLTDVPAVVRGFGTAEAEPLGAVVPADLREIPFAAGSMGPKVEAAARFVTATGRRAAIGAVQDAAGVIAGTAGTQITAQAHPTL